MTTALVWTEAVYHFWSRRNCCGHYTCACGVGVQFFLGGRCVAAVELYLARPLLDHPQVSRYFSVSGVHGRGVSLRRELVPRPLVPLFRCREFSLECEITLTFSYTGNSKIVSPMWLVIGGVSVAVTTLPRAEVLAFGFAFWFRVKEFGFGSPCSGSGLRVGFGVSAHWFRVWVCGFGLRSSGLRLLARVRVCELGLGPCVRG